MNEQQQHIDYLNDLSNIAHEQDKARLRSLILSFHSTLQRLPKLKLEMELLLQNTDNLDYDELVKRVEPALQQATAWLLKIDLLPSELANKTSIKDRITKFSELMMLATVSHLVEHFERELQQANPDYFYQQIHTYLEIEDEIEDTELKIHIFNNLEKAANLGHGEAAYYLFCCYDNLFNYKRICKIDSNKALYWLKKSAIQGFVTSQYYLGCYYNSGGDFYDPYEVFWFKGVKEKEGLYWMQKAAEQGHEDAINYLNDQSNND